ncbi:helix-turn-helix domain-containing protein [Arthrobacter sp. 1P04PC]|uniref:helix-turn-helix transcriptional regulator n=1 Tax=unclassified Arthrobacter TaxID=235627 RepID=UPI0039A0C906
MTAQITKAHRGPGAVKLLTLSEVAEMLRKTPAQLRWMRHNGSGPHGAKLGGRVMYREQDVIDWVNAAFEDAAS